MINSNRKSVDASTVTSAIVDDFGAPVKVGEQKDVGEFNINFLARINEALELERSDPPVPAPELASAARRELERSVASGMSVLLPVTPEQLNRSFVYSTFFGSSLIVTKATENNGKSVELQTQATFGQVIINAEEKDLYRGWEKNYYNVIEDFQTPNV